MNTAAKLTAAVDMVRQHWGAAAPQWVLLLAESCDAENQAKAARKIGRSAALVNQVLKNKYPGDLSSVEGRVMAALDCKGVECPVLGRIESSACFENQQKPYNPGNHVAVTLFTACRRCPHKLQNKDKKHAQ